jgi:hypothetical protein
MSSNFDKIRQKRVAYYAIHVILLIDREIKDIIGHLFCPAFFKSGRKSPTNPTPISAHSSIAQSVANL